MVFVFFWFASLRWSSLGPFMLLQIAIALFHSFLWPSSIPLYICITSSISIPLSMDIYIVFMHWILWLVLLWTYGCMYVFELDFCLDICPAVGLLDHMVILFWAFWGASVLFSLVAAPTYIPTSNVGTFLKDKEHLNNSSCHHFPNF